MTPAALSSLPLLSLLIAVPLLGALLMLVWPGSPTPNRLRGGAIATLALQLLVSVLVLLLFDTDQAGLQLQERQAWLPGIGLNYWLGVDGLSLPLVLINGALTLVSVVCTRELSRRPRLYFCLLLVISAAVNGAFLADNLLLFFLFYELEPPPSS
jgi:NAD(P)H-quinone oxidoreductase subunit 4